MIFGIPVDQLVPFLNFLGLGILGIIAAFGVWFGRKSGSSSDVEVAGALVDSRSVDRLTAAIEAHTMEMIAHRQDAEKARKARYRALEVMTGFAGEVEELRRAVVDMTNQIARSK